MPYYHSYPNNMVISNNTLRQDMTFTSPVQCFTRFRCIGTWEGVNVFIISLHLHHFYLVWRWIHVSACTGCQVLAHVDWSEHRCGNQIYHLSSSVMQTLPWLYDGKTDSHMWVMQFCSLYTAMHPCFIGFTWQNLPRSWYNIDYVMRYIVSLALWLFETC